MPGPGGELVQVLDQVMTGPCTVAGDHQPTAEPRRQPAIAAFTSAMWSAAVLLPAEPRRSIHASGSPVLSHAASSG